MTVGCTMTISWPTTGAMRPATTTTPFMVSRAERMGSAVLATRRSEPPKYRIHKETMESRDRLPVTAARKPNGACASAVPVVSTVSPRAMIKKKSTPLDHVVCVKATWLEPLN